MSELRRNIVANYAGQIWSGIMGLAFIPLYIRYLGMEAYGLIGLFATMQAWLSLLDMGMTPTLSREMARFTAGAHSPQSIRELLRSLEVVCYSTAALIGLGVAAGSGYLARDWLKVQKLPVTVVSQALSVMALVVALRFVEGIYRSSLFGLQRQVWYNTAAAALATLRHGGAALILAGLSATPRAFFLWQTVVSLTTVVVLSRGVYHALPRSPVRPRFSPQAIVEVWKFAGGMMGITLLALLLTQVDTLLLSRMLPLQAFGYYTLAASVAGVLNMVVGPITGAVYPRMVTFASSGAEESLASVYHMSAQLVTVMTAPAVMLLSFFGSGVLFMWSGNHSVAMNAGPILSALVLGTFLNGLMQMPYQCQLAHGWTSLTLRVNMVAVAVLVPTTIWAVPRYGAVGAAWIWVILNSGYVLVAIQFMHRRIIPHEKANWYAFDVVLPTLGAAGVMLLAKQIQPIGYRDRAHWFAFLLVAGCLALAASTALSNRIRPGVATILGRVMRLSAK